ncbi:MAG TPA: NTP transferase domain-containing protein [Candidatus Angelobacter sp.]|nr:NTP transferase domain-containing protein [Candidatus Angelobacter sp.]
MTGNKPASGVAAIVLAAGMSRRMGTPKQLLCWNSKPLLEHALENVRGSAVDEIVLVLGAAADEIRRQVSMDGLTLVENPDYQQGMGTSLRSGVSALSSSAKAAFVVLADQPFVRPATLDRMIASYSRSAPQVLIPLYRGFRGNPVLLDRSLFPELMNLAGDVGCRAVFGHHTQGIHRLPVDDPGILLDIDSQHDWKALDSAGDPTSNVRQLPDVEERQRVEGNRREIVILGRDAVAHALSALARVMNFTVTIVDPLLRLPDFPDADRVLHALDFSRLVTGECYVVVASRGQWDEEGVEAALQSGAIYTGLLANRKRAEEILNALRHRGMPEDKLSFLRAPAGLHIGAEGPQEIALSIMAEIVALQRRTPAKA